MHIFVFLRSIEYNFNFAASKEIKLLDVYLRNWVAVTKHYFRTLKHLFSLGKMYPLDYTAKRNVMYVIDKTIILVNKK